MFEGEPKKEIKLSKNLIDHYETLNKAVAISALVEKPHTVKNINLRNAEKETLSRYFDCQIEAVAPVQIPFPATVYNRQIITNHGKRYPCNQI